MPFSEATATAERANVFEVLVHFFIARRAAFRAGCTSVFGEGWKASIEYNVKGGAASGCEASAGATIGCWKK